MFETMHLPKHPRPGIISVIFGAIHVEGKVVEVVVCGVPIDSGLVEVSLLH